MTYLDAVLDAEYMPLFNSTPDEVRKWLNENGPHDDSIQVCVGKTMKMMSVSDYLKINNKN